MLVLKLHRGIVKALVLLLVGCGGGGTVPVADAKPPVVADSGFAGGKEFVLFSNDSWQSLSRSTIDGKLGEPMYKVAWSKKVPIQLVNGGLRYFYFESVPGEDDKVTLYDTRTMKALATQRVPPNSDFAGPLFGSPNTFLVRTFTGETDNGIAAVVDFAQGKVLGTLLTGGVKETIKALPDGRLYRINKDTGRIAVASADGQWATIGYLQIPAGRSIGLFEISHRGDRIALYYSYVDDHRIVRGDVWVANIDGSQQVRLTKQGDMFAPRWSPDDSRIAFQYDNLSSSTGGGLGGADVSGGCSYWYVPANAQEVSGIVHGQPHPVATQIWVTDGIRSPSYACYVAGWVK